MQHHGAGPGPDAALVAVQTPENHATQVMLCPSLVDHQNVAIKRLLLVNDAVPGHGRGIRRGGEPQGDQERCSTLLHVGLPCRVSAMTSVIPVSTTRAMSRYRMVAKAKRR